MFQDRFECGSTRFDPIQSTNDPQVGRFQINGMINDADKITRLEFLVLFVKVDQKLNFGIVSVTNLGQPRKMLGRHGSVHVHVIVVQYQRLFDHGPTQQHP